MRAQVPKSGREQYSAAERCYIREDWNTPEDPGVSIARARVLPGVTTARHCLEGVDERYLVISGEGLVEVADLPPRRLRPGDIAAIPSGSPQRITNTGADDLVFYCVCSPRFLTQCYRDLETRTLPVAAEQPKPDLAERRPSPRDLLDFSSDVVIVTGSSRGIGAGIAARFAEAGAAVAVNYLDDESSARELSRRLAISGASSIAIQGDVRQPEGVEKLFADCDSALGRANILINNAGVYPTLPLSDISTEHWNDVIDTNLRSVHLCTQAFARRCTAGAIVNILSIEALNPGPMHAHYSAAKGGALLYTQATAKELGPHGIRVNAVSPGLIGRPGIEQDWPDGVRRYREAAPLQRIGEPQDVADACLFLASPAARWITGANLVVDGGVLTNAVY